MDKKDFADGIHFDIWDEEMIPDFLERPMVVTSVLVRGRQEGRVTEQSTEVVQGRAPVWWLQKLEGARKQILPSSPGEEPALHTP